MRRPAIPSVVAISIRTPPVPFAAPALAFLRPGAYHTVSPFRRCLPACCAGSRHDLTLAGQGRAHIVREDYFYPGS
jgi:hypothetical protein